MAQIHLEAPAQFNFRNPDEWSKWRKRFEQYCFASKLDGESQARQISTLMYCLGEEAESVLDSTSPTTEEKTSYAEVLKKFDGYFKVRKNVIYEQAKFNRRNQLPGESAEEYIMQLYQLAETCDYGDLTPEMIRDRLVVGIRNTTLSERLQLDSTLTLDKAKKAIRQQEAVHQQQETLKGVAENKGEVDEARVSSRYQGKYGYGYNRKARAAKKSCTRCGKEQHSKDKCPAKDSICHKCNRKGHYAAQCFAKTVAEVQEEAYLDTAFLDTMSSGHEKSWITTVRLEDQEVTFKMDTGAEVTAISEKIYQQLSKKLSKPDKVLYGAS